MPADHMVFIQIVGRENSRVGERHTYPGLGRFPTSLWPVGNYFCDTYRFPVAAWDPAPELYDALVGRYDAETKVHLTPHNPAREEVALPVAATVRIAPQSTAEPMPEHETAYRPGENIELLAYDIPEVTRSQQPLTLTLYWRTGSPSRRSRRDKSSNYWLASTSQRRWNASPFLSRRERCRTGPSCSRSPLPESKLEESSLYIKQDMATI